VISSMLSTWGHLVVESRMWKAQEDLSNFESVFWTVSDAAWPGDQL